ncbi:hypothetical protein NXH53_28550, partial [Klebsiella pneumoniae]|nr:hypothetical protein [Klebsiella pneumoniae]
QTETEATGAPQKHHYTLNQQVGSITKFSIAKKASFLWIFFIYNQSVYFLSERKEGFHSQIQMPR